MSKPPELHVVKPGESLGPKLRVTYALVKAGPSVGVGETGAGMTDFTNGPEFIIWLQAMNMQGPP